MKVKYCRSAAKYNAYLTNSAIAPTVCYEKINKRGKAIEPSTITYFNRNGRIRSVEIIQVDIIYSKTAQRLFARLPDVFWMSVNPAKLDESELGRQKNVLPLLPICFEPKDS